MSDTTKATDTSKTVPLPSISVRLSMDRVVFLITDLQDLPELDVYAPNECQMRFHLLPGLLLTSPVPQKPRASEPSPEPKEGQEPKEDKEPEEPQPRQIVCPLLLDHKILPGKVQILQVSMENENPFYGLSMFAKITELPEYMGLVPPEIFTHLPYNLVKELFPEEVKSIVITDEMLPHPTEKELTPERAATLREQLPIKVNFTLPSGYRLPELYRGKIVRISLSLYARAGGLALNDMSTQLINSLSRPTRIYVASSGFETPADDYYQLRSVGWGRPVTSQLPSFYEDYRDLTDPNTVLLERRGAKP